MSCQSASALRVSWLWTVVFTQKEIEGDRDERQNFLISKNYFQGKIGFLKLFLHIDVRGTWKDTGGLFAACVARHNALFGRFNLDVQHFQCYFMNQKLCTNWVSSDPNMFSYWVTSISKNLTSLNLVWPKSSQDISWKGIRRCDHCSEKHKQFITKKKSIYETSGITALSVKWFSGKIELNEGFFLLVLQLSENLMLKWLQDKKWAWRAAQCCGDRTNIASKPD